MSDVKQRCQVDGCNRAASTRCFCCNKNTCTRHFTEHIDAVKAQIDPLANETNIMVEKIQGLTIEQTTEACFASLQQWKIDMHQLIDEIFSTKSREIENLVAENKEKFVEHRKQQLENIMQIQDDVKQLVEDGDATFEQIQLLKSRLTDVETNLTSFGNDFLSVNAKVLSQGLVTVSSNLNKPWVGQHQATHQAGWGTQSDSATKPTFGGFDYSSTQPRSSLNASFSSRSAGTTASSGFGQQTFGTFRSAPDPFVFDIIQSNSWYGDSSLYEC